MHTIYITRWQERNLIRKIDELEREREIKWKRKKNRKIRKTKMKLKVYTMYMVLTSCVLDSIYYTRFSNCFSEWLTPRKENHLLSITNQFISFAWLASVPLAYTLAHALSLPCSHSQRFYMELAILFTTNTWKRRWTYSFVRSVLVKLNPSPILYKCKWNKHSHQQYIEYET